MKFDSIKTINGYKVCRIIKLYNFSFVNFTNNCKTVANKNLIKFLIIIASLFIFINIFPQPNYYKFDNFRVEQGLSNNMVHCAFQDSKGWMWFGTSEGVNRFDGYKFITYVPIPNDTTSIKGTLIRVITEDVRGYLWMGADNYGLNRFDRKTNRFKRYLINEAIKYLKYQPDSILWAGTENGLYKINIFTERIINFRHQPDNKTSLRNNFVKALELDKEGNLWVGTAQGVDVLKKNASEFQKIKLVENNSVEEIQHIYCDTDSAIWIGTYNNGFFIYNPLTENIEQIIPDKNYERSYTVRKIIRDNDGVYWIATRGGVYLYNRTFKNISFISYSDRDPNSLANNSILDISVDRYGDIWIGSRSGISYMARNKQVFKHFKSFENDNRFLNNPEIYAFWLEKNGNLWIGTEGGGINILNSKTGRYSYITRSNDKLLSNTIKAFAYDNIGNLWVGSFLGGLNLVDIQAQRIRKVFLHNPSEPGSIADNRVWSVLYDYYGNLWVGTEMGLDRYDYRSGKFIHHPEITGKSPVMWLNEDPEHDLWIATSKVIHIYNPQTKSIQTIPVPGRNLFVDSKGRYWLTSFYKGLLLVDKQKGLLKSYTKKNGICDNRTNCIFEDQSGYLWISTANGLSRFDPDTEKFTNFDIFDGLQNSQFNYGAGLTLPSGEFIVGGVNGFNLVNPEEVNKIKKVSAPLVFTDFKIFYRPVAVSDSKNAILKQDISETKSLTIPYGKNVFTIEFALLNYANSPKNTYSYILEGFDKEWNNAGTNHQAVYTNLNPGKYKLKVRSGNSGFAAESENLTLDIKILPPFWDTIWFKGVIVLVLLTLFYALIRFFIYRNRLKQELLVERIKAKQIHELDLAKVKFFTNISHEIRTPLTLITGPVERLLNEPVTEKEVKGLLEMVHRNAQNLLRLVNQLLDFRKIESGNLKLELKKGNIVEFINSIVASFQQMAADKGISLKFLAVQNEIFSFFDPDKIEKIVNNLLSNALKYTYRGGSVTVSISLVMESDIIDVESGEKRYVEIVVKDTGIGIASSSIDKIFNRFFQTNEMPNQTGTGIGLSLTRELVKLHKGQIVVDSVPEKGSRFTVLLPFIVEEESVNNPELIETTGEPDDQTLLESKEPDEASDKILLVIEDNMDVRFYIRSHFEPEYRVIEAADGKEGLNVAYKIIPDIIITDILMPGTDGIDVCKKLKKDERTSHIPIILLSAITSRDSIYEGLKAGADDYITKPFDIMVLHTKVDNLFMLRRSLQMKYSGELLLQPKNITLASPDEKFLKKAIETVEKYIDDPDLDSDKFAQYIGVSRMQLYRKLGALTDMTVKDFIRDLRLKRAAQLLVQNKLNVSEVAYAVGFKDISHFRKCFRQEYGMTASEYVKKFGEVK